MDRSSHGTVESLLLELDSISTEDGFELWVPQNLTLRGQPVRADVAMAILGDKIIGMGFLPDGFAEADGGRSYKYIPM
jgi:hypothetical protein